MATLVWVFAAFPDAKTEFPTNDRKLVNNKDYFNGLSTYKVLNKIFFGLTFSILQNKNVKMFVIGYNNIKDLIVYGHLRSSLDSKEFVSIYSFASNIAPGRYIRLR